MIRETNAFSLILIIIHAALSANKILSKKLLSQLVYIVCKLLKKNNNFIRIEDENCLINVQDLHILINVLKNHGLIMEDSEGNILMKESLNYILSDSISARENIYVWRLVNEISRFSNYTISKIAVYLSRHDGNRNMKLLSDEEEMIDDLITSVTSRIKIHLANS